jgi:hypothetical protein
MGTPLVETVYLGRDNPLEIALEQAGQSINHTTLTRLVLTQRGGAVMLDSDDTPEAVSFDSSDRVVIKAGALPLPVGRHWVSLIVYDAEHQEGIYWQDMTLVVHA